LFIFTVVIPTDFIFKAGLFSAINSAFILQVQLQIQLRGTPLVLVVAQSLFYISLGSTLLAALLAVLGKQWLMFYLAAGERGTMEARCLKTGRSAQMEIRDNTADVSSALAVRITPLFICSLSVSLDNSHFPRHHRAWIDVSGVFNIHFPACINSALSRLSFPNSLGSSDSLVDPNYSLDEAEKNFRKRQKEIS
jgi:hypothetical protein